MEVVIPNDKEANSIDSLIIDKTFQGKVYGKPVMVVPTETIKTFKEYRFDALSLPVQGEGRAN